MADPAHSTVDLGTASAQVLAANGARSYALIQNLSSVNVFLRLGETAVTNEGIRLGPGGSYEISSHNKNLFHGAVNGLAESGSGNRVSVLEIAH